MRLNNIIMMISASAVVASCGSDTTGANQPNLVFTGENLVATGRASLEECISCAGADDPTMSYQTPLTLHFGLTEVALLRSATDPAAHVLFRSDSPTDIDMVAGSTFCDVDTGSIPQDTYTHLRVSYPWVRYSALAYGHATGMPVIEGVIDIDYATGDYDSVDAGPVAAGDYTSTFTAFGNSISQTGNHAVDYPPPYPGATVSTAGDRYEVTYAIPEGPVTIDHDVPESIAFEVTYFIDDAFGWIDLNNPGFTTGNFDVTADTTTESPASLAIRGYELHILGDGMD